MSAATFDHIFPDTVEDSNPSSPTIRKVEDLDHYSSAHDDNLNLKPTRYDPRPLDSSPATVAAFAPKTRYDPESVNPTLKGVKKGSRGVPLSVMNVLMQYPPEKDAPLSTRGDGHFQVQESDQAKNDKVVIYKVSEAIGKRGDRVQRLFRSKDQSCQDGLRGEELREGLAQLGVPLNHDEFACLTRHLQSSSNDIIYMHDFSALMRDAQNRAPLKSEAKHSVSRREHHPDNKGRPAPFDTIAAMTSKKDRSLSHLLDSIEQKCKDRGLSWDAAMKMFDVRNRGALSKNDMVQAFRELGLPLSNVELGQLLGKMHQTADQCYMYEDVGQLLQDKKRQREMRNLEALAEKRNNTQLFGHGRPTTAILQEIQEKLEEKRVKPMSVFTGLDVREDGMVEMQQVKHALATAGVTLSQEDLEGLCLAYTTSDTSAASATQGTLSHVNIRRLASEIAGNSIQLKLADENPLEYLPMKSRNEHLHATMNDRQASRDAVFVRHVVSQMKKNPTTLRRMLRRYDGDKDGKIAYGEFKRSLADSGIHLSNSSFERFMLYADREGSGTVDVAEFEFLLEDGDAFRGIAKYQNGVKKREEEDVLNIVSGKLKSRIHALSDALVAKQMNAELVSVKELEDAMDKCQIVLDKREQKALFDRLDMAGDGMCSMQELNRLCVSHARILQESELPVDARKFLQGLHESMGSRYRSFQRAFRSLDSDRDGRITHGDLRRVLLNMGVTMSDGEARWLIRHLDPSNEGMVGWQGVRQFVLGKEEVKGEGDLSELTSDQAQAQHLLDEVKLALRKRKGKIGDLFRSLDSDHDGVLSYSEFDRALSTLGVELSSKDMRSLIKRFDVDQTGSIDYSEFAQDMAESEAIVNPNETLLYSHEARMDFVQLDEKLVRKLRRAMEGHEERFNRMFERADVDRDGLVTFTEARRVLLDSGIGISDMELRRLFGHRLFGKDDHLHFKEFTHTFAGGWEAQQSLGTRGRAPSTPRRSLPVELSARLRPHLAAAVEALKFYDPREIGDCSVDIFRRELALLNVHLSEQECAYISQVCGDITGSTIPFTSLKDRLALATDPDDGLDGEGLPKVDGSGKDNLGDAYEKSRSAGVDNKGNKRVISRSSVEARKKEQQQKHITERLVRVIFGKGSVLRHHLRTLDGDGDGFLSTSDLCKGLQDFGVVLTEKEVSSFLQESRVVGKDGHVNVEDFVKTYAFASKKKVPNKPDRFATDANRFMWENGKVPTEDVRILKPKSRPPMPWEVSCGELVRGGT